MQISPADVLVEYREHVKNTTDDLIMHRAAVKNLEARVKELDSRVSELEAENESLRSRLD